MRFSKPIVISHHAQERMAERNIDAKLFHELIERGQISDTGGGHLFVFGEFHPQHDNLLCAAIVIEDSVVVKTVMVNWVRRRQP